MLRGRPYVGGVIAAALIAFGLPASALAISGITGRVTSAAGSPLVGIGVAAVPVGGNSIVQTTTGANGLYTLAVPAGTYEVGFNAQVFGPIDVNFEPAVYGGPGPGPTDNCIICHGAPVTVTDGVETPNINAALAPAPFTQNGFVRPLSGRTIGVVGGQIGFMVGCHEYPDGCMGTAYLQLGRTTHAPRIATANIALAVNAVAVLHFKIPTAVQSRLRKAGGRGLPALVQLVTPQNVSVTHFTLVGARVPKKTRSG